MVNLLKLWRTFALLQGGVDRVLAKIRNRGRNARDLLSLLTTGNFLLIGIHSIARLNSHYETWSYKKNKYKKINTYRKSV